MLEELGARLRRARLERNLSQADLAERAGVGRVTVQRTEMGNSTSLVNLVRLLRALDLFADLDQLVPETAPSPIAELERQGRRRQRAGTPRAPGRHEGARSWRWGDEEDEERRR